MAEKQPRIRRWESNQKSLPLSAEEAARKYLRQYDAVAKKDAKIQDQVVNQFSGK